MATLVGLWITGYLFPWICGFVVTGIVVQTIDMYLVKYEDRPWVPSYRKWYNRSRTAEDHLPPGTMGWFYNQTLPRQHNRAMCISGVQSLVSIWYGANALAEFFAFLAEGWAMLPGLWLGVYAFNYLNRQDQYMQTAEGFRAQLTGMSLSGVVSKVFGTIRSWRVPAPQKTADPSPTAAPEPPAPAASERSGRERFRDAMKRKGENDGHA